ncbi:MAG: transglutaminase domain-containing protein [Deltaproteobacteria bacterium]|nr:MAG: transglutaminase domain-containing protein [Deltaproteobacteria bacterium]
MTPPTRNPESLRYYATPGPFSDLGAHAARVRDLPEALPELCRVVQGLVVHPFLSRLYGLEPDTLHWDDLQVRSASEMLDRVLALDPGPLSTPRAPAHRFVGNCRHFTVLLCAFLRARSVPARARCGFGAYLEPSRFEDHWVCEVWDAAGGAWRLVNLLRDLAARRKRELLPWDSWGLMGKRDRPDGAAEVALLDRVAELTQAGDARHAEVLQLYDSEPGLRVPRVITSLAAPPRLLTARHALVLAPVGEAKVDLGPGVVD